MSIMFCEYCDRLIDTDETDGHQFEPDFKCENCVQEEEDDETQTICVE